MLNRKDFERALKTTNCKDNKDYIIIIIIIFTDSLSDLQVLLNPVKGKKIFNFIFLKIEL